MKYKVGDKVKVREDLVGGRHYNGYTFVKSMKFLCGKICTVKEAYHDSYILQEDFCGYSWTDGMLEDASLKDELLVNGNVVVNRDGSIYLTVNETLCGINMFNSIDQYESDLSNAYEELCIMKVYKLPDEKSTLERMLTLDYLEENATLLWEREDEKEMTLEEIEKELGYKVKIVGSKE